MHAVVYKLRFSIFGYVHVTSNLGVCYSVKLKCVVRETRQVTLLYVSNKMTSPSQLTRNKTSRDINIAYTLLRNSRRRINLGSCYWIMNNNYNCTDISIHLIHFYGRRQNVVLFISSISHIELSTSYPGALSPLPATPPPRWENILAQAGHVLPTC